MAVTGVFHSFTAMDVDMELELEDCDGAQPSHPFVLIEGLIQP